MKVKWLKEVVLPAVTNQEVPDEYEVVVKMYKEDKGYKVEGVTVDFQKKELIIILL